VETLPLFEGEKRSVLTAPGLDLVAFKSMQTPTRFRTRRAWPADHAPLTRSPRHMQYILAFMFALLRDGRLGGWDLVQARYEYCVAIAPWRPPRPRRVELVPDSGGILTVDGREVPFWLEIDRGLAMASGSRGSWRSTSGPFRILAAGPSPDAALRGR
jgi:hypothetical protein